MGRRDVAVCGVAVGLVMVCAAVGRVLLALGFDLQLPFPPIIAWWGPHVGWGSVPALLVLAAIAVVVRIQHRLAWRRLLLSGWLLGLGWIVSLALVDGDWTPILQASHEYLSELPRITDPLAFLATFSDHVVDGPGAWTTHVAAHPPLATLVFWALDRIGLGGGWWAGLCCMVIGSVAAPALAQVVRDLGDPTTARRLVPLGAVFPGAVWIGVSADGMFAGVAAAGLALLVHGLVRTNSGVRAGLVRVLLAAAGGVLLGAMLLMSYGHVLVGLVVVAILVRTFPLARFRVKTARETDPQLTSGHDIADRAAARGSWAWWLASAAGATGAVAAVLGLFAFAGFWWPTGLAELRIRYHQGIAATRPYWYFVVANLAALVVAASPLLAVAVRHAVLAAQGTVLAARGAISARTGLPAAAVLAVGGIVIVLLADLSGLSKAETERIWLTFGLLVWCGLGLVPASSRGDQLLVLAAGAWALVVNHLLVTGW